MSAQVVDKKQNKKASGFTLIEILVVIGMIALLATVVLIAINPARQFRQGRDTQRVSNVNAILNAIGQNIADNKGIAPAAITTVDKKISAAGADLCSVLMPTYIPSLPQDPTVGAPLATCPTGYDTKYWIKKDAAGRITVSADQEEPPLAEGISATR